MAGVTEALATELERQEGCDLMFIVEGQTVGAHKFMLKVMQHRCKVLQNMTTGWNNGDEPIAIAIIDFDSFKEVLRYIYTGETVITNDNIFKLLSAAVQLEMHHLEELCVDYISKLLCTKNVCHFMNDAVDYKSKLLIEKCCELFSRSTFETLKDPTFLDLQQPALSIFLDVETTDVVEITLFYYVKKWMAERCTERRAPPDGANMREAIDEALHKIRFPTMNGQDFANSVSTIKGFLTESETAQIFQKIMVLDNRDVECAFSDTFRCQVSPIGIPFNVTSQLGLLDKSLFPYDKDHQNLRSIFKCIKNLRNYQTIHAYSLRLVMQCYADLANSHPCCKFATRQNQNTRSELLQEFDAWKDVCKTKNINNTMTKFMELRTKLDQICAWGP